MSLENISLDLLQITESWQARSCNALKVHNHFTPDASTTHHQVHITQVTNNNCIIGGNSMICSFQYLCWSTEGTFHYSDLQDLKRRTVPSEALVLSVFLGEQLLTELTFSACRAGTCVTNGEPDLEVSQAKYNCIIWSFMSTGQKSRWCWGNRAWKLFSMAGVGGRGDLRMADSEGKIPEY